MNRLISIFCLFFTFSSFASLSNSLEMYERTRANPRLYDKVVAALIADGYYFAAIPFAKEYLTTTRNVKINNDFEASLESLIGQVGVRQFETMPDGILRRSSVIKYCLKAI